MEVQREHTVQINTLVLRLLLRSGLLRRSSSFGCEGWKLVGRVALVVPALAGLLVVGHAAWADPIGPVKWTQMPDMGPYGYDFSSETTVPSMAADDFLCEDGVPVIDVHWWGSYSAPGPLWPYYVSDNFPDPTIPGNTSPGILQGFNIEFYTDVPAGVDPAAPWSHPGTLLYDESVAISSVAEVLYGTVVHVGGQMENVWQYNVDLLHPFFQDAGTIYWLKIQAVHSDESIQWGWHEAESLWHDNAVQMGYGRPGMWEILTNKDMAFELSVPEPATLALLGAGMIGILIRRRTAGTTSKGD
jgi:hypothetical protein